MTSHFTDGVELPGDDTNRGVYRDGELTLSNGGDCEPIDLDLIRSVLQWFPWSPCVPTTVVRSVSDGVIALVAGAHSGIGPDFLSVWGFALVSNVADDEFESLADGDESVGDRCWLVCCDGHDDSPSGGDRTLVSSSGG